MYRFKGDDWIETENTTQNLEIESLKLVTWNILFDIYDSDRIYTDERYPRLLEYLKNLDADIIGLQGLAIKYSHILRSDTKIPKKNPHRRLGPRAILCFRICKVWNFSPTIWSVDLIENPFQFNDSSLF